MGHEPVDEAAQLLRPWRRRFDPLVHHERGRHIFQHRPSVFEPTPQPRLCAKSMVLLHDGLAAEEALPGQPGAQRRGDPCERSQHEGREARAQGQEMAVSMLKSPRKRRTEWLVGYINGIVVFPRN